MKNLIRLVAAALAAVSMHAMGQSYPSKSVRVIISFTPASATDIVGRIVGAKLSEYWGQPVVAENRSGAGGSLGSNVVAQAAPNGYTLLINSNAHAVNPAIYAKLPYDTTKDFTDIAPLSELPNVLVVNGGSRRALANPGVREKLANTGNTPMDMSPAEFARFVRSEIEDYSRTARAAGIKPQ